MEAHSFQDHRNKIPDSTSWWQSTESRIASKYDQPFSLILNLKLFTPHMSYYNWDIQRRATQIPLLDYKFCESFAVQYSKLKTALLKLRQNTTQIQDSTCCNATGIDVVCWCTSWRLASGFRYSLTTQTFRKFLFAYRHNIIWYGLNFFL